MKDNIKFTFGFSVLALLIVGTAAISTRAYAQDSKPIVDKPIVTWEYKVLIPVETGPDLHEQRRQNLEIELNQAGKEGWEAVDMPYLKGVRYQVIVMKRPVTR